MPAASSTSVKAPLALPDLTMSSCASPPAPAIPSAFVTDPAARDATNVPCPFTSRTSPVPERVLYVCGVFAAMSGAARSAPVSMTAICTDAAARSTDGATASACVARFCHSQTARGVSAASVTPGSATELRDASRWTKRMPRACRSVATSAGAVVRTSATRRAGSTRTTTAGPVRSAVRSAARSVRSDWYPTASRSDGRTERARAASVWPGEVATATPPTTTTSPAAAPHRILPIRAED